MKFYNNSDNFRERTHTIQVTFQIDDYVGHIAYKMGGNCMGLYLLDYDPDCVDQEDIDTYVQNDCQLSFDEDTETFHAVLKNPKGDMLEIERDPDDFKDIIVAIEIIDCQIDDAGHGSEAHDGD